MNDGCESGPSFVVGTIVSTMFPLGERADGRPLWDRCCDGRVAEVVLRDGKYHYRIDGAADRHFHHESEVCVGDTADLEIDRLNRTT